MAQISSDAQQNCTVLGEVCRVFHAVFLINFWMCYHAYNIIGTSVVPFLTSSSHKLFTLPSRNYYPSQVCNSCIFHNQTEGFRYCLSWLNRQSDSYGCKTKTTKPYCLSWSCSIRIREQSTWVTVSSFLQIRLTGTVTAIQSSLFSQFTIFG